MLTIIAIIIGYLLGSINFAILSSRYLALDDPRHHGSGNPGATNMLRTGNYGAAMITLLGDAAKGLIAVLIGHALSVHGFWLALVALAVFIGHLYPVFFKFKGGKGVATLFGLLLGLHFSLGIVAIIIWLIIVAIFAYASLASLVTVIIVPINCLFLGEASYFIPLVIISAFIIYRHQDNIERLRRGQERKISFPWKDKE
ncbi:MAG: glycerol-3-phosphate 1-O-acyltransferase PlsY [Pseudomonadota bacterium]